MEAALPRPLSSATITPHGLTLIALIGVLIGLSYYGVGLGLGHDLDSRAIFENSVPAILRGSYVTGRSFGDPLFEYPAAWLYAMGGIKLANAFSTVLAIGAILLFDQLLIGLTPVKRVLALVGFGLHPVFLTNSFCFAEWSEAFFLICLLLVFATRWMHDQRTGSVVGYAVSCSLLVLTRPDAGLFCGSLCLAVLWEQRFAIAPATRIIGASATAAVMTAGIFLWLNGGPSFLGNLVSDHNNTWLRSVFVAAAGILTLFGPVGLIVLLACGAATALDVRGGGKFGFWGRLVLVASVIGFARYVLFPQKLEYVFYLVPVAILWVADRPRGSFGLAVLTASLVLPTFVTVSVLERSAESDHLRFSVHVNESAILQDMASIKADWDIMQPEFLRAVSESVYRDETGTKPLLFAHNFGPGLQSNAGDLIIGGPEAYRLDNPRSGQEYRTSLYRRIYVCDRSIFHGSPGWRFLEQPVVHLQADRETGQVAVTCSQRHSQPGEIAR